MDIRVQSGQENSPLTGILEQSVAQPVCAREAAGGIDTAARGGSDVLRVGAPGTVIGYGHNPDGGFRGGLFDNDGGESSVGVDDFVRAEVPNRENVGAGGIHRAGVKDVVRNIFAVVVIGLKRRFERLRPVRRQRGADESDQRRRGGLRPGRIAGHRVIASRHAACARIGGNEQRAGSQNGIGVAHFEPFPCWRRGARSVGQQRHAVAGIVGLIERIHCNDWRHVSRIDHLVNITRVRGRGAGVLKGVGVPGHGMRAEIGDGQCELPPGGLTAYVVLINAVQVAFEIKVVAVGGCRLPIEADDARTGDGRLQDGRLALLEAAALRSGGIGGVSIGGLS